MPEVVVCMSNNIIEHVICVCVEAQHKSIYNLGMYQSRCCPRTSEYEGMQ